jgi:hypothetical protein
MTRPFLNAIAATVLVSGTLGALLGIVLFGVVRIADQGLEAVGVLPLRWGEQNLPILMTIAGIATLPFLASFIVWFWRLAVRAERDLVGYKYVPPRVDSVQSQPAPTTPQRNE